MLKSRQLRAKSRELNQEGITSIVVVFVLVTLLTLISIGFTKIMNRSLQSSSASQQATAANYAAESGVNDVLSYLKTQPLTATTKCDDLIKTGAPLASAANLSGDGSTAYSCVLVDPNPTSLFYKDLDPYKSQIVKITTSAPLTSLLFSWQSPNRQHYKSTPAGASQTLYDEKTWSDKNYAPLLGVTLYPIPVGGNLSGVQAASKTFFLYPQIGGSNTLGYNGSGDTSAVNCSSKNIGSFSGSADFDCNLVINNLPNTSYFYARFAPYYDQAIVKIKGNDASGQPVKFKNVQSVVDVTAKSGGATKRLQARVDTSTTGSSGSDSVPEFALGSADTICKRLRVQGSLVFPDPSVATACPQIIIGPQKPTVNTTDATNVQQTTATLNGNVNPNGDSVLTCSFNYGATQTYGSSRPCASLPGSGNSPVAVSANIPNLSQGQTYHFRLCATNIANSIDSSVSCGTDLTFKTKVPDPILSFYTDDNHSSSISIQYNTSTNLHWRITAGPADWCYGKGGMWGADGQYVNPPTGGDINTGFLTSSQTYHLYCGYNSTGYQTPTQTVKVTVADPPQQPPPPVQPPPQPYLELFDNPEDTNSFSWTGGHLQYCHIWGTDKDGNNLETDPVGTRPDGGNTTLGNGTPNDAYIQCRNQAGTSNTLHVGQVVPPPPPSPANIVIYPPSSNIWSERHQADPDQYDFSFSSDIYRNPTDRNDCRDGFHNLVLCFNLSASVDGDSSPSAISYCTYNINGSTKTLPNIYGTSHWSSNGWWVTVSSGWSYTIPSSSPTVKYPAPPYNLLGNTISANCFRGGDDVVGGRGGTFVGSANTVTINNNRGGFWHTCGARGDEGKYYNDAAHNNCDPTR
ncbi:MAG: hypothetical protein Q7R60_03520 [bacterium]|nr:hypothetical protein [bacterium]